MVVVVVVAGIVVGVIVGVAVTVIERLDCVASVHLSCWDALW